MNRELKQCLYAYVCKKIWYPLFLVILLIGGCYLFYFDVDSFNSVAAVKYAILFPLQACFAILLIFSRFNQSLRVLLDLITGCKAKTLVVTVLYCQLADDIDCMKKDQKRYDIITIREGKRKTYILQDRKVCDYSFVRGNIHTVQVLKYSHFLLNATVGKKLYKRNI